MVIEQNNLGNFLRKKMLYLAKIIKAEIHIDRIISVDDIVSKENIFINGKFKKLMGIINIVKNVIVKQEIQV